MEVDMRHSLAACLFAAAAVFGHVPSFAQEAAAPERPALQTIIETELPPERRELALKLVQLSGTSRMFDELLPTIADQAKNNFIRANPQMQLGIIDVVDRVAVSLVSRRPELNEYLAKVWASAFTDAEMQDLIDFYGSPTGQKFAGLLPQVLAVETAAAQEWSKSVGAELTEKVTQYLRTLMTAVGAALQGDVAGPAEEPAPQ
jgi:hypothetical protein